MIFHIHSLRFTLEAKESVFFPDGKAANVLRGALGTILDDAIFRPKLTSGPSGLADPPRPFVFRASHLDGLRIGRASQFDFTIHLFDASGETASHYAAAVRRLSDTGLGPGRAQVSLVKWTQEPVAIDLAAAAPPVTYLTLRFLTPTEIKGAGGLLASPDFGILMARIRDRISTLRALYGGGPLEMDFRAFAEQADQVRILRTSIQAVAVERTSSRTGQSHSLGGFTGEASYEGDLAPFVPFLNAAVYTGVGRQTVWGKGEIALLFPQGPDGINGRRPPPGDQTSQ